MKKINIFLLMMICLIIIPSVSGLESMGTFKQNREVTIVQICSDATYINISSIGYPSSGIALTNKAMTNDGNGQFSYKFNDTVSLGRYDVRGFSNGCQGTFTSYFEVTPSGYINTLGFYIVLLSIIAGVIFMGFSIQEAWFVVIGGMTLIILGLYSLNSGIAGFRDDFITYGIALFEIGIGATLSIGSAVQKMDFD